jgi:hypothetical protein
MLIALISALLVGAFRLVPASQLMPQNEIEQHRLRGSKRVSGQIPNQTTQGVLMATEPTQTRPTTKTVESVGAASSYYGYYSSPVGSDDFFSDFTAVPTADPISALTNVSICEFQCGGESSGGCWCDSFCNSLGDCCADYGEFCNPAAEVPSVDPTEEPSESYLDNGDDYDYSENSTTAVLTADPTAGPTVGPTADPTTDPTADSTGCVDDTTWISTGNPTQDGGGVSIGKNCAWITSQPNEYRCDSEDASGVKASVACFCANCASANVPADVTDCVDDMTWVSAGPRGTGYGCAWVAVNPVAWRCLANDATGITAYMACPLTCGVCTQAPTTTPTVALTVDSTEEPSEFYLDNGDDYDHSENSTTAVLTADPTAGPTVGPTAEATAGPTADPTTDPTADSTGCVDDTTWISTGNPTQDGGGVSIGKNCAWITSQPNEYRCDSEDASGVKASVACFCANCASANVPADVTACVDDMTWVSAGPRGTGYGCAWVAVNPVAWRCLANDVTGVTAYMACPLTCGVCT